MRFNATHASRLALACAMISCLPSTAAHADETAVADGSSSATILVLGETGNLMEEPQSTGSRLNLSPLETPASVAIIDGDVLRARGDQTIQDAVTRAPGITNVANPGNGGTALAARGFSGQGSVLQLVDGVRLFPVAGTITFPTDPWMTDRIEVLSGPASVLYGQGALGGAVNVVTRKPNPEQTEGQGQISFGSQQSVNAAVGIAGPLNEMLSYRLDASYRRSDGYVRRGESRSYALAGALRFAPVDTFALTLRHDYGNQKPSEYFGTPLIDGKVNDVVRKQNFNVADAELHYKDNRTTLTADWDVSDNVTVNNTAYRLTSWRLFKNLESYFYNPDTGMVDRSDNLGIVHDQTQIGNVGSVKLSTPLGGSVSNDLVIGFEVNQIKLTYGNDFGSDPQEDSVDPFNPQPGLFYDTQGIAPRYRTKTDEYAFFAEDRLKLTSQLSLVGGIRYEHDRVRRWTFAYDANDQRSETQVLDKKLSNTTWRVGAVYQPTPTLSLYGQYSTGVDPLGTLTTYSTGQVQFSNAKGDQIEFGVKTSFLDGKGWATLAAYKIVKKKLLAQQTPTSPVEQIGQRSAQGIEAAFSIDLPAGFGVDANGTVLDADFDDFISGGVSYNGLTPPGVPEKSANLWVRWDAMEHLQARAGLRYVGKRYSDNRNEYRVPAYTVVDAVLSYALSHNAAIDLRLYNIFDKDYAVTTYNDGQWILGRPRSIDVALRASF